MTQLTSSLSSSSSPSSSLTDSSSKSKCKQILDIIDIYSNACSTLEKRSLFISKVFDILWDTIAKCKCKDKEIPSIDDIERIYFEVEERGYQY
jgi:hypothetical protein